MSLNELPVVTSKLSVLQQYRSVLTDRGLIAKQDIANLRSRGISLPRVNRYGVRQYTVQPSKQGYGILLEDIDDAIGNLTNRIPESLQWLVKEYQSLVDNATRLSITPVFGLYTEKTWLKPFPSITSEQVTAVDFSKSIGVKRSLDATQLNRVKWFGAYAQTHRLDYSSFAWFLEPRMGIGIADIVRQLPEWVAVVQHRIQELLHHLLGGDVIPYKTPEEWTRGFLDASALPGTGATIPVWAQVQNKLWLDLSASDVVLTGSERTAAYYVSKAFVSPKQIIDAMASIKDSKQPDFNERLSEIKPEYYQPASDARWPLAYLSAIESLSEAVVGIHYSLKVVDRVLLRMRDLRTIQNGILTDIQTYTRRTNKRE